MKGTVVMSLGRFLDLIGPGPGQEQKKPCYSCAAFLLEALTPPAPQGEPEKAPEKGANDNE